MSLLAPASKNVASLTDPRETDGGLGEPGGNLNGAPADALIVGVAAGDAGLGSADPGLAADAESAGPSDALGTKAAFFHLAGVSTAAGKPDSGDGGSGAAGGSGVGLGGAVTAAANGGPSHIADASANGDAASGPAVQAFAGTAAVGPGWGAAAGAADGIPGPMMADQFNTISVPGSGLVFNNDFTGAAIGDTEFQNDIAAAERTLARFYTNSVTVDLTFNDANSGNNGVLASNSFFGNYRTYSTVSSSLASHQFIYSPSLPGSDPSGGGNTWFMPLAYERMLGAGGGSANYTDDSVSLNTFYSPINSSNDTTIINAMMHEISEGTMGRIGGLGGTGTSSPYGSGSWAMMDLFRFDSTGARDYTNGRDGKTTYFSVNGGTTRSTQTYNNQYNSGGSANNTGDTADFTQLDVFGVGGAGETFGLSLTDIQVMDVLGWDPYYTVAAGQTSTGIVVEYNGGLFVQSGGKVVSTDANGGFSDVQNGGVASYTYIAGSDGYDGVGGDETVFSGGISYYSFINGGGTQVLFGGESVSATIGNAVNANQLVFGGGFALNTFDYWNEIVYSGGIAEFTSAFTAVGDTYLSGGTAYFTTLSGGAGQFVYSGGLGYEAFVSSGSFDDVLSSGTTSFTVVYAGGTENVFAGGLAWYTDITSGGSQYVYGSSFAAGQYGESVSGTIAVFGNEYVESGGFDYGTYDNWNQYVYTGGQTQHVSANTGNGDQYISGGVAYYTSLTGGAGQFVYSGGLGYEAFVSSGGFDWVLSGGTTNFTQLYASATQIVFSGGVASNTNITSGGAQTVYGESVSGSIALFGNEYVSSGGLDYGTYDNWNQFVYSGGVAEYVSANTANGDQYVSGGTAYFTSIISGADQFVYSGGLGYEAFVYTGSYQEVFASGTADYTVVSSGGRLFNYGNSFGAAIYAAGTAYTENGGVSSATYVASAGAHIIYGTSYYGTIVSGGNEYVSAGGLAYGTADGWNQFIYAGGLTEYVSALTGAGDQYVSGGTTDFTYLSGGGGEVVYSAGVSNLTVIANAGFEEVVASGTANATQVSAGGILYVFGGGHASGTQVFAGGREHVYSGGVETSAAIGSGGIQVVESAGQTTGTALGRGGLVEVVSGAQVTSLQIVSGDVIDFLSVAPLSATVAYNWSTGALTVTPNGGTPETITLAPHLSDSFHLYNDGGGSTDVTLSPASADYNADGFADVLYQNEINGQWSFEAMNNGSPAGTGVAASGLGNFLYGGHGDINGDGFSDIVIQNPANGQLFVGKQNGSGTPSYQALAALPGWRPVGVGDINRDGYADIVIQNQISGVVDYYDVHNAAIDAAGPIPAGFSVVGVGDVNGDGYSDIVLQNFATGLVDYINMAGGINSGVVSVASIGSWQVRAVGDLNGDRYADIVIQNPTTGQVVYANMKGGSFNNFVAPTTALNADFVVKDAVDVNNDGFVDLVVQQESTGTVNYALQNAGGFASWGAFTTGLGADGQVAGNGLSLTHAAALASDYTGSGTGDVLFRNVSTGQLEFEKMSAGGPIGTGLATGGLGNFTFGGHGDINHDGIADVVVQDPSSRAIYVGQEDGSGSGVPSWSVPATMPGWTVKGVGDINGDGFADIVMQNDSSSAIDYYDVHNSHLVTVGPVGGFGVVGVGDVNGDGDADIVIQNSGSGDIYYLNMAGGAPTSTNFAASTPGYAVKAVGDLTGDGYADIVVENTSGQTDFLNMLGGTFQGNGTATTMLSSDYQITDAVDVFNNGHADLIVQQLSTGATIYAQEGANGFLQWGTVQTTLGTNWAAV